MAGALQLKTGETEAGKANLLKAYEADPADAETWRCCSSTRWSRPRPPRPAAPCASAARSAAAPVAGARGRRVRRVRRAARVAGSGARRSGQRRAPPAARPAPRASRRREPQRAKAPGAPAPSAPAPRPPPRRAARPWRVEERGRGRRRRACARARRARRLGRRAASSSRWPAGGAARSSLGGYFVHGRMAGAAQPRVQEARSSAATEQLKHDSFDSYKKACEAADKALEVDPDSTAAHGYLAYAYAIRWGEHGGGDDARQQAEEHLAAAQEERARSARTSTPPRR